MEKFVFQQYPQLFRKEGDGEGLAMGSSLGLTGAVKDQVFDCVLRVLSSVSWMPPEVTLIKAR